MKCINRLTEQHTVIQLLLKNYFSHCMKEMPSLFRLRCMRFNSWKMFSLHLLTSRCKTFCASLFCNPLMCIIQTKIHPRRIRHWPSVDCKVPMPLFGHSNKDNFQLHFYGFSLPNDGQMICIIHIWEGYPCLFQTSDNKSINLWPHMFLWFIRSAHMLFHILWAVWNVKLHMYIFTIGH